MTNEEFIANLLSYYATFGDERGARDKCALRGRLARKSIFGSIFATLVTGLNDH